MSRKCKRGAEWGKGATSMSRGEMAVALMNNGMLEDMTLGPGAMGIGAWGLRAGSASNGAMAVHMPTWHLLNAKPPSHTI